VSLGWVENWFSYHFLFKNTSDAGDGG